MPPVAPLRGRSRDALRWQQRRRWWWLNGDGPAPPPGGPQFAAEDGEGVFISEDGDIFIPEADV